MDTPFGYYLKTINSIMKAKEKFKLMNICGENIIIAEGKENIDFSKIISMNDSSVFLWNKIGNNDFTNEDLANWLTEEYEVKYDDALADCKDLTNKWLQAGIIE